MDENSVIGDVHAIIDARLAAGQAVQTAWVVTEILNSKNKIEGEDAPFYRVCASNELHRIVSRAVGKFQPDAETDAQLVFAGWKRLVKAYPVQRNGDLVLVPIDRCTDAELLAHARSLDDMARGCRAHAGELRQYIKSRPSVAA